MFQISCPDLLHGTFAPTQVLDSYGCTGGNISPRLQWSGAPAGTKSFALIFFDPDGNGGKGWWHWTVANIPASVTGLAQGATRTRLTAGALETVTSFDTPGYGGPCPEEGELHHYVFTLYALSTDRLAVEASTAPLDLRAAAEAHSLGVATLTVPFQR
jgi:Raf kinase inhibitor-like YbhB/YbcL family protein